MRSRIIEDGYCQPITVNVGRTLNTVACSTKICVLLGSGDFALHTSALSNPVKTSWLDSNRCWLHSDGQKIVQKFTRPFPTGLVWSVVSGRKISVGKGSFHPKAQCDPAKVSQLLGQVLLTCSV